MRVFTPANIKKIMRERHMSFGDFMRRMIKVADNYDLEPANNHVHNIINGKVSPGAQYLALFADVLECQVDAFYVKKGE